MPRARASTSCIGCWPRDLIAQKLVAIYCAFRWCHQSRHTHFFSVSMHKDKVCNIYQRLLEQQDPYNQQINSNENYDKHINYIISARTN